MFEKIADILVYDFMEFDPATRLGESLHFFFYDSIKIISLIYIVSLLMGVINDYIPVDKVRNFLTTRKLYGLEYLLASLFGAVTPFCSCSSIPLFIGFVRGGIPLGATFSFLITSPLVNEVALAVFLGSFGWKLTLIYGCTGVLLGTLGGWVLGRFNLSPLLSDWAKEVLSKPAGDQADQSAHKASLWIRLPAIANDALNILKGVILYVIIGIAIGAGIHGYVPEGFFENYLQAGNLWGVPAAVLLAVPMYANASGIVPLVEVFVSKGVPIGTALAFMMATVGLSLPEAVLLKKVMTGKLIAIFFGVTAIMMIISGYLFNAVL